VKSDRLTGLSKSGPDVSKGSPPLHMVNDPMQTLRMIAGRGSTLFKPDKTLEDLHLSHYMGRVLAGRQYVAFSRMAADCLTGRLRERRTSLIGARQVRKALPRNYYPDDPQQRLTRWRLTWSSAAGSG
jgi:hypothetical protein